MPNEFRAFDAHIAAMNNLQSEEDLAAIFSSDEIEIFNNLQQQEETQTKQATIEPEPEAELSAEEVDQYNSYIQTSPRRGTRYTLDELERDPKFQETASRFMEDIGRDEEIFEYLRDSDWSLASAIMRSREIKDWSSQAKQDYIYLRDTFDNADLGGFKQTMNLLKDATIDTVADPFTIAALGAAAFTGGASIGTKTAIEQALKQGIKKQAKAELRASVLKDAGKTALFTAAEGAAWVGPHDYFMQKADVELDLKNNIDPGSVALSTAFGGIFGGAFGGLFSLSPFLNKQLRLYSDEDTIIKAGKESPEQLELSWKTEEDRRVIAEPGTTKGLSRTDKWIANSFGKYTTRFLEAAKSSEQLQKLLGSFRYDWARTAFDTAVAKIDRSSFGEALSKMRGSWIEKLNTALVTLDRTGQKKRGGRRLFWINKLDFDQNDQLYYLLSEDITARKMPTELGGAKIEKRTRDAAVGVRNLYNEVFREAQKSNNNKARVSYQYAWELKDAGLIDNIEDFDLVFDALIEEGYDPVKNYFSRKLQHEQIKKNPQGFDDMLMNYGRPDEKTGEIIPHAMPNNEWHPKYITEQINRKTGEKVEVIDSLAKTVDQEAFGRTSNFMIDDAGNHLSIKEGMKAKAAHIRGGILDLKDNPLEAFSYGENLGATERKAVGSTGFMRERLFDGVPVDPNNTVPIDRVISEFIDTDVENVLNGYITSASMIINRERYFGKNIDVYKERYLTPIFNQLIEKGVKQDEADKVTERLQKFYTRVTGIDIPDLFADTGWRTAADWGKTAQTMAHLPFATLSSITEPLILLTRVGYGQGPQAGADVLKAIGKESRKMGERIKNATKRQFGLKHQGTKDVTDEVWKEAYQVGLALEQAVHDRLAGLYGEIHSNSLKRANRGFFKTTLLQQWTSAVQLAAFTTGKRHIRQHAQLLAEGGLSKTRKNRLIKELRELGVDENKAVKWYNNSLDSKGVFNEVKSQTGDEFNQAFYNNQYMGGANRFSREIILNPDITEANKPLWYTHPAGQILMQFASYPTAFNNTILKRYAREISKDVADGTPHVATPKIIASALLMTNVGILTNAARSQGKSLEKEDHLIVIDGVDRWGGLGPMNHAYRYWENTQRGSGPLGGLGKASAGPLLQDLFDTILYRKGLAENVATNLPFYSTYDILAAPFTGWGESEARKSVKDAGKDIDNFLFEVSGLAPKKKPKAPKKAAPRLKPFDKGGVVTDVPRVPREPDERVDRMTGLPYNIQAGILGQDEEDRASFAEGGLAEVKKAEQAELYNTVSKKVRRLAPIYKDKEPLTIYLDEELDDFKQGITEPMYRSISENTEEQSLIDLRDSERIGAHVSSSPESEEDLKGYVRLVNPLDVSDSDIPLEGFTFLEEVENNSDFKNKIISDSMLPDKTATELVEHVLSEHGLIKRAIKGKEETPTLTKLLNINASHEIRESLKDLGFDSIIYSQGNTVDDQMEDLGMREGFFAGGVARLTNKWAKQFFSKKYVGGGRYSAFINDLKKKGLSQEEINKISLEIREDHLKVLKEKVPQFKDASIAEDGSTIKLSDTQIEWLRKKEPTIDRVMVGNHGIYVEFKEPKNKGKKIKPRTQYIEWNRDGSKLYQQTKTVNYANYRTGKWYNDIYNYLTKPKAAAKKAVLFDNGQQRVVSKTRPEDVDKRTLYIFADNEQKKYKKGSVANRARKMANSAGVTVSKTDIGNMQKASIMDFWRDRIYKTEGTVRHTDSEVPRYVELINKDLRNIIDRYGSGRYDKIVLAPDFYRVFNMGYSPTTKSILQAKMFKILDLNQKKPAYIEKAYPRILEDIIGIKPRPMQQKVYLEPSKSGKSYVLIDPKQKPKFDKVFNEHTKKTTQGRPYQIIETMYSPTLKKADPAWLPGTTIPGKSKVKTSGIERYDIEKRPRTGIYEQDLELKEMQRELQFDNPYIAAKNKIEMYNNPTKNEYNPEQAEKLISEYFPGAESIDEILKLDDKAIERYGTRLRQIGGEGNLSPSEGEMEANKILKQLREEKRQKKASGGEVLKELVVKVLKKVGKRGRPAYDYAIEKLGEDELDKLFLREIAFVESKYANDEGTFRPQNRSAYQITPIRFKEFQDNMKSDSKTGKGFRAYANKIKDKYNLDLSQIQYDDLNDPIIGTAVTRALWKRIPEPIGSTPKERARQWKKYWNSESGAALVSTEKYLKDVAAMETYPIKRDLGGSLLERRQPAFGNRIKKVLQRRGEAELLRQEALTNTPSYIRDNILEATPTALKTYVDKVVLKNRDDITEKDFKSEQIERLDEAVADRLREGIAAGIYFLNPKGELKSMLNQEGVLGSKSNKDTGYSLTLHTEMLDEDIFHTIGSSGVAIRKEKPTYNIFDKYDFAFKFAGDPTPRGFNKENIKQYSIMDKFGRQEASYSTRDWKGEKLLNYALPYAERYGAGQLPDELTATQLSKLEGKEVTPESVNINIGSALNIEAAEWSELMDQANTNRANINSWLDATVGYNQTTNKDKYSSKKEKGTVTFLE